LFLNKPREIPTTGDDRPAGSLFAFVWRMSGWHQIATSMLALMVSGLTVVPLELQRRIIDDALADRDAVLLGWLCAAYLAVVLANGAIKLLLRLYQGWLTESVILYCRNHLTRLHEEGSAGDDDGTAVSVATSEIEAVGGFVGTGVSDPVSQIGILVAIGGYMIVVEPMIALVSVFFLGPQVLLMPLIQRRLNALVEKRVTYLRGISDRIAGGDERGEGPSFRRRMLAIYRNRIAYYIWKFSGKAAMNLLNALAPLMVLAFGGWMVVQGETEIGVIVAFISGFERMADPLRELIAYYRLYAQTSVKHDLIAGWMVGGDSAGQGR